jgi:ATP-binding cassette subfamily B protein
MAWGGGMFGGGGGGIGANNPGNPGSGLPFAGIPEELHAGVEQLLATEPEWPAPNEKFTQRAKERGVTLRRMLGAHRGPLLLSCALVVIEAVGLQAGPFLSQIGIDDGITPGNWTVLVTVAIAAILCVVVTALASGWRYMVTGKLSARVMFELRVRVFAHLQRLSLDYYTDEKAGVIMTRMTSDIEALQQLLQEGLVQFAVQGLTMVVVTIVLFFYSVKLALITLLLIVPILTALSLWFRSASDRGYNRVRDGIAGVLSDLSESLSGVRIVSGFNRARNNVLHHRNVVGEYRDANDYTAEVTAVYGAGSEMIGVLGQAALLFIGGTMVQDGTLSVGELVAFIFYLASFFLPIQQLVQQYNLYQQGRAAIVKLNELLSTAPSVEESADAEVLPPIEGDIMLEDVTFGYDPAIPVLSDVDLHIAAGETMSFVGATGAGKSTIAKLVTRFYDPTEGRVLIDGHDLRDVTIRSLRSQLGVVPQEPFLFAGTLRDNIAFARPDATDDEVWEAVHRVGLTEFTERLSEGLDTPVHERGVSLASGERQLLALARAFLAKPRVLVLDEATSNLDLKSETLVEAGLDAVLEGRTAIIVAHRLSTAMRADRIAVVDDGHIVELGSHQELVARNGRYAEMFAAWTAHMTGNGHTNGDGDDGGGDGSAEMVVAPSTG